MNKIVAIIFLIVVASIWLWMCSSKVEEPDIVKVSTNLKSIITAYPKDGAVGQVVTYSAFTLEYNEKYEQAEWVMYLLTNNMVENKVVARKDHFREDNQILTGSAIPDDYKGSGYDKGHLCPSGDMTWSETTMDETFFMTNMSPQVPSFNRGIWKNLEEKVREWALANDSIVVITGPVLTNNLPTIGINNKIGIPLLYYKIIVDISTPTYKTIAFVMKNEGSDKSIFDFAVSIDSVENLTGINFCPDVEGIDDFERTVSLNEWQ